MVSSLFVADWAVRLLQFLPSLPGSFLRFCRLRSTVFLPVRSGFAHQILVGRLARRGIQPSLSVSILTLDPAAALLYGNCSLLYLQGLHCHGHKPGSRFHCILLFLFFLLLIVSCLRLRFRPVFSVLSFLCFSRCCRLSRLLFRYCSSLPSGLCLPGQFYFSCSGDVSYQGSFSSFKGGADG